MARRHVGAHAAQIGTAAAADVEDGFIAAPGEVREAPGCEGRMAFIHAGQHLFARFACRFGHIINEAKDPYTRLLVEKRIAVMDQYRRRVRGGNA